MCGYIGSMTVTQLPFDLTDPEGLVFDEQPAEFVDLSREPIVFTVRGLTYFARRFKHVGVAIGMLRTRLDFEAAYSRWLDVEITLLTDKIDRSAAAESRAGEHSLLSAIWRGDLDCAETIAARMEHRKRAGLRVVGGVARES